MASSPQTLSIDERRAVAWWAAACAQHVLGVYEGAVSDDPRVRDAIVQARAFASGDLAVGDAIRARGGDAGGAAREAPTPAARAAAYAAEQAAAVAHMGAHALGAAGYAVKAAVLAADADDERDLVIGRAVRRQLATMSNSVARALALLPALGEDSAGPLGRGRLGLGHVGHAIRAIQAAVVTDRRCAPGSSTGSGSSSSIARGSDPVRSPFAGS